MKKNLVVSSLILVSGCYLNAADDMLSMIKEGEVSGQVRAFYIDRKFQGTNKAHRNSTAIGGHLKYETAEYNNIKLATAFYTTNALHIFDRSVAGPSLLGTGGENYSVLGEAYLNYNFNSLGSNTEAKLGYQRYDTPMMGSDDVRMVPNTFEAYKFVNKDLQNFTFQIAHVNAVAYGTYSNLFINSNHKKGIVSITSGYSSLIYNTGKYYNLGELTTGKSTAGVTNFYMNFENKNFFATLSNDYAWDLYNTLYGEAGTTWNCLLNDNIHPFVRAQFIKQNSVGGKYMQYSDLGGDGEVDSLYGAIKVGANYKGLNVFAAYSKTGANKAADAFYKNAIISQFGGMPAYTASMVTRHQFLAGTKVQKYAAEYSFKEFGVNLSAQTYFASYDVDKNSGYGVQRTSTEAGFDVKYTPQTIKELQLRLRGNFPRKFAQDATSVTSWDELRFIANYTF